MPLMTVLEAIAKEQYHDGDNTHAVILAQAGIQKVLFFAFIPLLTSPNPIKKAIAMADLVLDSRFHGNDGVGCIAKEFV